MRRRRKLKTQKAEATQSIWRFPDWKVQRAAASASFQLQPLILSSLDVSSRHVAIYSMMCVYRPHALAFISESLIAVYA